MQGIVQELPQYLRIGGYKIMKATLIMLVAVLSLTASVLADLSVSVKLSPSALVLGGPGEWVTAHTDIALSLVDRSSVELDGIAAVTVKADNRGQLVAKFRRADVEAIVEPGPATLTLTGLTTDGEPFSGEDTIRVTERK